jgi:hypothetical protein
MKIPLKCDKKYGMKFQAHFTLLALDFPLKGGEVRWIWGAFTISSLYVQIGR